LLIRLFFFLLKFLIFFAESFDATGGIDQLLLAGEKRVAFGANLDADVCFGRSDFQHVATGALNGGLMILRMNLAFHFISTP
jgi:hypothetical protein